MKRFLLLIMLSVSTIGVWAQQDSTYHAFVERGKTWCVHGFDIGMHHTVTNYYFPSKDAFESIDGHDYYTMRAQTEDGKETIVGLFREEDRRVYLYDNESGREYKIYDFNLMVGDRFEPEYGDYSHCEVTKVGSIRVNGETLKTITFEANDRQLDAAVRVKVEWIEGIGHSSMPLAGLFSEMLVNSWGYVTAYVQYDPHIVPYNNYYLPFSFDVPASGWHGCLLQPIKKVDYDIEGNLKYELIPDPEHDSYALHVYGYTYLNCGPNHYVYCIDEMTEDLMVHRISLQVQDLEPLMDCRWPFEVDLYFHFFLPEIQYIVVDEQGEHPIPVKDTQASQYHPLAKEGKVWNCKRILSNKSEWEHYSYMVQGDTVINDLSYKKVYLHKSDFQMYAAALRDVGSRTYIVQAGTDFERIYCEMDIDVLKRASDTVCVYIPYGTPRVINTDGVPLKDVGWIVSVGGVGPTTTYNWIEGVGAPDEIFMPTGYAYMRTFEAGVITSCYEDGVCIWHDGEDVVNPPSTPLLISHEYKPGADKSQSPSRVWGEYNANMYWTVYFEDAKTQYSVSLRHPDGQIRHRDETSTLKGNIFYEAWGLAEGENTITFENDNETFTIHVTWPWEPETYRPFIEDGKVWHTGINPGNGFVKQYEYRLFGDTIIDGKTCRVLGRSELKFNAYFYTLKDTVYAGALYEEGHKVYGAKPGMSHLELLYDFESPVGTEVKINGDTFTITGREKSKDNAFKGVCTYIQIQGGPTVPYWMEGVGGFTSPMESVLGFYPTGLMNEILISCSLGDEVIYMRDKGIPADPEVKKQWLDFTHTVKTRPKAPGRMENEKGKGNNEEEGMNNEKADSEQDLTGEYSARELFVNLKTLSGTYDVMLKDGAGQTVYQKVVQTNNIVALCTDLTKYAEGTYTLTIENSDEAYTATFTLPLDGTGVRDLSHPLNPQRSTLNRYDLTGRRLAAPPSKGIYIENGRKKVAN